jgi:hypothetical protein
MIFDWRRQVLIELLNATSPSIVLLLAKIIIKTLRPLFERNIFMLAHISAVDILEACIRVPLNSWIFRHLSLD